MNDTKERYRKLLINTNRITANLNQAQAEIDRVFNDFVLLQTGAKGRSPEGLKLKALIESLHKISIDAVRDSLTALAKRIDHEINPPEVSVSLDLIDDSAFYSKVKH